MSIEVWPEDPTPIAYINCEECELAQQRSRMIWGEGNPDAEIFVVLDNPGAREDKSGSPFVCGTRETLYQTAKNVGLGKEDLYITYVLRCRPLRKYDKEQSRTTCLKYLHNQLNVKDPKFIVCLGNIAAQSFLGTKDADIKSLRGKITYYNGTATAFTYHPLAIRRRPNLQNIFLEDWALIASFYAAQPITNTIIKQSKTQLFGINLLEIR